MDNEQEKKRKKRKEIDGDERNLHGAVSCQNERQKGITSGYGNGLFVRPDSGRCPPSPPSGTRCSQDVDDEPTPEGPCLTSTLAAATVVSLPVVVRSLPAAARKVPVDAALTSVLLSAICDRDAEQSASSLSVELVPSAVLRLAETRLRPLP